MRVMSTKRTTPKRTTLRDEIKQTKAFASLEAEVYLNLVRTSEALVTEANVLLRGFGLSGSQYNVLRILRGAGTAGLCGRDIAERMVTRDSDMTRLLDGLQKKDLIARLRSEQDRRIVMAAITDDGLALLADIEEPLLALHRGQLGHLGDTRLKQFSRLLEDARHRP